MKERLMKEDELLSDKDSNRYGSGKGGINLSEKTRSTIEDRRGSGKFSMTTQDLILDVPGADALQFSPSQNSGGFETGFEIKDVKAMPMSPNGLMRRTFYDRTFSKMEAGSVRGSIFQLSASAIGAGVLSLPYVLALNGYALGIFFICLGAFASGWSNMILAQLACDNEKFSYN